jgi:hypothetical protein
MLSERVIEARCAATLRDALFGVSDPPVEDKPREPVVSCQLSVLSCQRSILLDAWRLYYARALIRRFENNFVAGSYSACQKQVAPSVTT